MKIKNKVSICLAVAMALALNHALAEITADDQQTDKDRPQLIDPGQFHILLVDDDEMIRMLGEDTLKKLGYKYSISNDGPEALQLFEQNWKSIDLVILDMIMPQMSGKEVFRKMKEINPEVNVILASGFSSEENTQDLMMDGLSDLIQKPYRLQDLSNKIHTVLSKLTASDARFKSDVKESFWADCFSLL